MGKYLIVFIWGFYSCHCLAQVLELPTDSAVWHYSYEEPGGTIIPVNYSTVGDTMINNNLYTLISTDFSTLFILRQDSTGKAYARFLDPTAYSCTDTNELLIYNFNLNVNDTFISRNCYGDSSVCIVVSKDSILTSVGYRAQLTFTVSNDWVTCHSGLIMRWINGIGNYSDLFYSLTFPLQVCLLNYTFNSLDDAGQNIYIIPNSVVEIDQSWNKVWVDKNGLINSINIISELMVFDMAGRLVLKKQNLNVTQLDLRTMMNCTESYYGIRVKLFNGINNSLLVKLN